MFAQNVAFYVSWKSFYVIMNSYFTAIGLRICLPGSQLEWIPTTFADTRYISGLCSKISCQVMWRWNEFYVDDPKVSHPVYLPTIILLPFILQYFIIYVALPFFSRFVQPCTT
jgi:hypothetical protein